MTDKVRHLEILPNGVYTPCEVAALLKFGMEAVYRYIRDGDIPSFRIGKKNAVRPPIRIKGSDLLDYIEKQKKEDI
jgi:excisionase family DNA binding protein